MEDNDSKTQRMEIKAVMVIYVTMLIFSAIMASIVQDKGTTHINARNPHLNPTPSRENAIITKETAKQSTTQERCKANTKEKHTCLECSHRSTRTQIGEQPGKEERSKKETERPQRTGADTDTSK